MYSKAKGINGEKVETLLPPGYAGNRFRYRQEPDIREETPAPVINEKHPSSPGFFSGIGREELLIIALIMTLSSEKGKVESDTLLMLLLLLVIR